MLIPDPSETNYLLDNFFHTCSDLGSGEIDKKQPAIRYASGDPLYRWSFASATGFPDQEVALVTGKKIQPQVEFGNIW